MRDRTTSLASALRAGTAADDWGRRAAVELLLAHGYWLRTELVLGALRPQSATVAHLLWSRIAAGVDATQASSSERAILRLACSLAGAVPAGLDELQAQRWSLRTILQSLDAANARLALTAIAHALTGQGAIA